MRGKIQRLLLFSLFFSPTIAFANATGICEVGYAKSSSIASSNDLSFKLVFYIPYATYVQCEFGTPPYYKDKLSEICGRDKVSEYIHSVMMEPGIPHARWICWPSDIHFSEIINLDEYMNEKGMKWLPSSTPSPHDWNVTTIVLIVGAILAGIIALCSGIGPIYALATLLCAAFGLSLPGSKPNPNSDYAVHLQFKEEGFDGTIKTPKGTFHIHGDVEGVETSKDGEKCYVRLGDKDCS